MYSVVEQELRSSNSMGKSADAIHLGTLSKDIGFLTQKRLTGQAKRIRYR
jgi:hypothetical protein